MNKKSYLTVGNITTIINSIIVILAGYIFGFLVSIFGVGLPFTESQLASFISALVFAVFAYINAKDHNNFWDSEKDVINIPVDLSDAEIKAIENFIQYKKGERVQITRDIDEEDCVIEDCDPATEYELNDEGV